MNGNQNQQTKKAGLKLMLVLQLIVQTQSRIITVFIVIMVD